jgi:predicted GH43/DUF377 family glycosyl hydrolase
MKFEEPAGSERLFEDSIRDAVESSRNYIDTDVVIGIPFYNEKDSLPAVLRVLEDSLKQLKTVRSPLIVCAGDPAGHECLTEIRQMKLQFPCLSFLMLPGSSGRGASIRAIFEIAVRHMEADVILLAADLARTDSIGMTAEWPGRLIETLRADFDLAVGKLVRRFWEDFSGVYFVAPLLEMFYNWRINDPLSNVYAISHDLVENFCINFKFWEEAVPGFGIDPWMITRAIQWKKKICEVPLGAKPTYSSPGKMRLVFKETAGSLFSLIMRDQNQWAKERRLLRIPDSFIQLPDETDAKELPLEAPYSSEELVKLFKRNYTYFDSLFEQFLPGHIYAEMREALALPADEFRLSENAWAQIVYGSLFNYSFAEDAKQEDILNALTAAYIGKTADHLLRMDAFRGLMANTPGIDLRSMLAIQADTLKELQRKTFLRHRREFFKTWEKRALKHRPLIIPAHYLEFVPGTPVVLPKTIKARGGKTISTDDVFKKLSQRYRETFNGFIHRSLDVHASASSKEIVIRMEEFMSSLDQAFDRIFPGDISGETGTRQAVDSIFSRLPSQTMFTVKEDILESTLIRFPPHNFMIYSGLSSPQTLIKKMGVRDAISLVNLSSDKNYLDQELSWILDELRPEGMSETEIKPIVLGLDSLADPLRLGSISRLDKLAARLVISPFTKGVGGKYAKLRFCLFIVRQLALAGQYSIMWRKYTRERRGLGIKMRKSLADRYETDPFSIHNILENYHHRDLVSQFRSMAVQLAAEGFPDEARLLEIMCEGYGLSQVLADGTFLPCSAWTWAGYSYKGGHGVPSPLPSHVESRWFNHDLLEEIYRDMGYDPEEISESLTQYIGEGRGGENLFDVFLGIDAREVTVVRQDTQEYPPAGLLVRHNKGEPLLSPVPGHTWENKYVFNAAAIRLEDKVYILYRAHGDDDVSRIGLAITDGYNVLERLPQPIFEPREERDKRGVEDPRVTRIENKILMLYTSYDGVIAQITAASITVEDFVNRRFDLWVREGFVFEDIWNKNAILFPEKINGRYLFFHRIEPSVWSTYLDKLEFPVPREKHVIIFGPRSGRMWDSLKIGAGAQPIKTRYGWLLIYHGVDQEMVYRLGVILTDTDNPERILYRSPNPVLSPETKYETGLGEKSWVPNVVFTCGAAPAQNKEILDAEDEVLVYYGASDTYICLATAKVGDLIPEQMRRRP